MMKKKCFRISLLAVLAGVVSVTHASYFPFEQKWTDTDTLDGYDSTYFQREISSSSCATGIASVADDGTLTCASAPIETDPTVPAYTKMLTSATVVRDQVKTVDGSGSGLDADLLDGSQGSTYVKYGSVIMNTNSFGGDRLYVNSISNPWYLFNERYTVSGTYGGTYSTLFDGNYEAAYIIPAGQTDTFTMDWNGAYPGYPYGDIYLSFYYTYIPETVTGRVYTNYAPHGVGWHTITFTKFKDSGGATIYKGHNGIYAIEQLEISIEAQSGTDCRPTQVEMSLDRPGSQDMPFLEKYKANTLYKDLNFASGTVKVDGNSVWHTGNDGPTSGMAAQTAATATALVADPTACGAGLYVSDIAADGTLTCSSPADDQPDETTVEGYIANDVTTNYVPRDNGTKLVTGAIFDNGTNVGIGTANPGYKLDVAGDIKAGGRARMEFDRSIGGTTGNTVALGYFSNDGVGKNIRIHIKSHTSGMIDVLTFDLNDHAYIGATTDWLEIPLASGVSYSGIRRLAIDVYRQAIGSTGDPLYVRIRNLNGAGAGNIQVVMEYDDDITFTPVSTQSTTATAFNVSTAPAGGVVSGIKGNVEWDFPVSNGNAWSTGVHGIFIKNNGNVGVGTALPGKTFAVDASIGSGGVAIDNTNATNTLEINGSGGGGKIYWDSQNSELVISVN